MLSTPETVRGVPALDLGVLRWLLPPRGVLLPADRGVRLPVNLGVPRAEPGLEPLFRFELASRAAMEPALDAREPAPPPAPPDGKPGFTFPTPLEIGRRVFVVLLVFLCLRRSRFS